jgi:transcriptional regulator with XRE-family HTH domain
VTKGKQTGRPGLSDSEAKRVRDLLQRLLDEGEFENLTQLARALERTQPAVTQLLAGTNKASFETLKRVAGVARVPYASLLDGGSPPDLLRVSDSRTVEYDPRYPNRSEAIDVLIRAGEDREEVEQAADAVAVALSSAEDLSTLDWLDDIRAELRRLRRGGGRVGARQVTPDEARAAQDETARRFEAALKPKGRGRKG